MRYFFVLAVASLITFSSLSACPPNWNAGGMSKQLPNGCWVFINFCFRYSPIQNKIEIQMGDVEMESRCGCIKNEELIEAVGKEIVRSCINYYLHDGTIQSIPPCPSQTFVAQLMPATCKTDCIETGCFRTWPDGSNGPVTKRFACSQTGTASCRFNYSACCPTVAGSCPPVQPEVTYLGKETLGEIECGFKILSEGIDMCYPCPNTPCQVQCSSTCD